MRISTINNDEQIVEIMIELSKTLSLTDCASVVIWLRPVPLSPGHSCPFFYSGVDLGHLSI